MNFIKTVILASALLSTKGHDIYSEEQTSEPIQENVNQEDCDQSPSKVVIIPCIKGIMLLGSHCDVLKEGGWDAGCAAFSLNIPGNSDDLTCELESRFVGTPLSEDVLFQIKELILCHYRKQHHPFVNVEIPEQNVTSGIIQFVVVESTVGKVSMCGNKWFTDTQLMSKLGIVPGDNITTQSLMSDVAWINESPFHRSEVRFSPGADPATTDIELVTTDRFPLRPYFGADNTGNRATGQGRWFAGITWGNAMGLDHIFSYQVTTSTDCTKFISNTLNYLAPLPWKHNIQFFGGYAKVTPHINHHFHSEGHSSQASVRYEIPFGSLANDNYMDFRFGFDYKNTNNNLLFLSENEVPIIDNDVNITQAMIGFDYGSYLFDNFLEASIQFYGSPGEIIGSQTKHDYDALRCHSTADYYYMTMFAKYLYSFYWDSTILLQIRTQFSNENLLPSEQMGLGGYDTVRGYQEREVNVDNGACINLELRSQPFNVVDFTCYGCHYRDELILLAFYDYGNGYNHHQCKGDKGNRYHLMSVGPGLRYKFNDWLTARLDVGFKLQKTPFENQYGARVHFGILGIY